MFRPRVIPVLLLKDGGLMKSTNFSDYNYIGDPINAVKIFSDLRADEIVFLDIEASLQNRCIDPILVKKIGEESNMPFAVGGGIRTLEQIKELINAGAEKVVIGTAAIENPDFIYEASSTFGSSTIVVCIDVKKGKFGKYMVFYKNGRKKTEYTVSEFAVLMEQKGAGEIIIQNIDRDGIRSGYDINLIKQVSDSVTIPVVALGGAGSLNDLKKGFSEGFASGVAGGSFFIYNGSKKGVLINYPAKNELIF